MAIGVAECVASTVSDWGDMTSPDLDGSGESSCMSRARDASPDYPEVVRPSLADVSTPSLLIVRSTYVRCSGAFGLPRPGTDTRVSEFIAPFPVPDKNMVESLAFEPLRLADFGGAIRLAPQKIDHRVRKAGTAFILP